MAFHAPKHLTPNARGREPYYQATGSEPEPSPVLASIHHTFCLFFIFQNVFIAVGRRNSREWRRAGILLLARTHSSLREFL